VAKDEPQGWEHKTVTSLGAQYGLGTCKRTLRARRSFWWPVGGAFLGIGVSGATGALVSPYAAPGAGSARRT